MRLAAVNKAARHQGLEAGMALNDARAILPSLATAPARVVIYEALLDRLARWFDRYSPRVMIDRSHMPDTGPDGLLIDIAGAQHLFGDEEAMLADMHDHLERFGLTAHLAVAPTVGAAWALSHAPRQKLPQLHNSHKHNSSDHIRPQTRSIATDQPLPAALSPLPVTMLRLSEAVLADLARFGLKRIGDLLKLPRASLARRFDGKSTIQKAGQVKSKAAPSQSVEAVVLRLDQLLGQRAEPVAPEAPLPTHYVRRCFAEPLIEEAAFASVLEDLLSRLMPVLEQEGLGARTLSLIFERVDGVRIVIDVASATANRDCQHFQRLYRDRLGSFEAAFGVDEMRLVAKEVEALRPQQTAWQETAKETGKATGRATEQSFHPDLADGAFYADRRADLSRLVDHLSNRFGAHRLTYAEPVESHLPERAERFVPILSSGALSAQLANAQALQQKAFLPPATPPRPIHLLERPEAIDVVAEVPEGPPRQFKWRRIVHHIARAEGPERLAPEWWRAALPDADRATKMARPRDYFRIENDVGQRFWIYRDGLYRDLNQSGEPSWFIHGLFA